MAISGSPGRTRRSWVTAQAGCVLDTPRSAHFISQEAGVLREFPKSRGAEPGFGGFFSLTPESPPSEGISQGEEAEPQPQPGKPGTGPATGRRRTAAAVCLQASGIARGGTDPAATLPGAALTRGSAPGRACRRGGRCPGCCRPHSCSLKCLIS